MINFNEQDNQQNIGSLSNDASRYKPPVILGKHLLQKNHYCNEHLCKQ